MIIDGCSVGPDYHHPKTPVPASFSNSGQPGFSTNQTLVIWWRGFNDPKLNELIELALHTNLDLRIATANIREARALRHQAQADFYPVVNADASYTRERLSTGSLFGDQLPKRDFDLWDAGFDATWELDIFGRVRRNVEATTADLQAAEARLRDMQVSVISEVARTYLELRGTQEQLRVARRNAENQRETLNITQARLDGGRGTELDTSRARAQMNTTLATVPPLESAVARSIHRLSVLTARQPAALETDLKEAAPLPALPQMVDIGDPGTLLRRRPDIRAAERQVAAATARIGVSVADLFPRVTFNGNIGFEASTFTGIGGAGTEQWTFGPKITWAALDIGHVRGRIKAANARTEAALATYEKTVLTSLEETENALVEFGRDAARREFLGESAKASETAADLARQRFENGATDFLTVLDAERVMLEAQSQLAQSQTETATALIAVYKALGGGWESREQSAGK